MARDILDQTRVKMFAASRGLESRGIHRERSERHRFAVNSRMDEFNEK